MPLTTLNYQITKIKQDGYLDKQLKLTPRGLNAFRFVWENENKKILRAHNIQILFNVVKCPDKFPGCFSKTIYQPLTNKRYKGIKTKIKEITVMFYSPQKIVCVLPDVYGDNDVEISSAIQVLIPQIKELLEYEFQGVRIGTYELANIKSMHIAVLNSVIAETYLLKGFTEENKDYAIDKSHGIPETELTNASNALKDIMELVNLDKQYRGLLAEKEKDKYDNGSADTSK
jgi:hypothetical protein